MYFICEHPVQCADLVVERAQDQPSAHHESQEQDQGTEDVLAQFRERYAQNSVDCLQISGGGQCVKLKNQRVLLTLNCWKQLM